MWVSSKFTIVVFLSEWVEIILSSSLWLWLLLLWCGFLLASLLASVLCTSTGGPSISDLISEAGNKAEPGEGIWVSVWAWGGSSETGVGLSVVLGWLLSSNPDVVGELRFDCVHSEVVYQILIITRP